MYFTVLIEKPDVQKFVANTQPIFRISSLTGPTLEEYINETVTIAYNEETGMVVVIG